MTHDLANPLAFLVSNYQFLNREFADAAKRSPDIEEALRDSGEGLRRIEQLMSGLRASSALVRSSRPARVCEALDAVLMLVEPRLKRNVTVVRNFDSIANRLVEPLPFMRLVSSLLIDAAERCAQAPRGTVTLSGRGDSLTISIEGAITRHWAPSLKSVADGLTFDVAFEASSSAAISLRP